MATKASFHACLFSCRQCLSCVINVIFISELSHSLFLLLSIKLKSLVFCQLAGLYSLEMEMLVSSKG